MAQSKALQSFYASDDWRTLRQIKMLEAGGKCAMCHKDYYTDTSKLTAHHIDPLTDENLNDPYVALNLDNVMIVCHDCHNKIHGHGFKPRQNKKVAIVYGPPLSGKSSYVMSSKSDNDLIVDLDNIWQAVTGLPRYTYVDGLLQNVIAIRDNLLEQIRVRNGFFNRAWVVGGYPYKGDRDRLAQRLGAECIYMDVPYDTLIARAEQRQKDYQTDFDFVKIIDKWFDKYDG